MIKFSLGKNGYLSLPSERRSSRSRHGLSDSRTQVSQSGFRRSKFHPHTQEGRRESGKWHQIINPKGLSQWQTSSSKSLPYKRSIVFPNSTTGWKWVLTHVNLRRPFLNQTLTDTFMMNSLIHSCTHSFHSQERKIVYVGPIYLISWTNSLFFFSSFLKSFNSLAFMYVCVRVSSPLELER